MLKSIQIQNFQSHRNTTLELDPGLNIIVGNSDSGKTAIIRALRWLIKNRPGGDAFRSTWGGETQITLTTEEGDVITRSKGDRNLYTLNDLEFEAFKTDVPEEILTVLNMGEINLQSQFDMPFLLNSTPGEIAAHFNKLAHIEKIDTSTKKINSFIDQINQTIKRDESILKNSEEELKEFENLDEIETQLEVLEELEKQMIQKANSKTKLLKLIQDIQNIDSDIEEASKIVEYEKSVDSILTTFDAKSAKEKERRELLHLTEDITGINTQIAKFRQLLTLENPVNDLLELYVKIEEKKKTRDSLESLISKIELSDESIQTKKDNLKELQTEFDELMGDTCILCGQPIKKEK
jgi:DNA repair exonuclease SbcCD ATPase subunit